MSHGATETQRGVKLRDIPPNTVYLLQEGDDLVFKIGKTDAGGRATLQTGNYRPLRCIHFWRTTRTQEAENWLKRFYDEYLIKQGGGTEFYQLPVQELRWLASVPTIIGFAREMPSIKAHQIPPGLRRFQYNGDRIAAVVEVIQRHSQDSIAGHLSSLLIYRDAQLLKLLGPRRWLKFNLAMMHDTDNDRARQEADFTIRKFLERLMDGKGEPNELTGLIDLLAPKYLPWWMNETKMYEEVFGFICGDVDAFELFSSLGNRTGVATVAYGFEELPRDNWRACKNRFADPYIP